MQENEKYGVVITAITQYFKKGMQELSKMIKNFGNEAEEETTITPKLETNKFEKQYQKQIDYVKAQMEEIETVLSAPGKMEPIDIAEQEDAYERLFNKLQDLLIKQEKVEAKKFEPVDDEVIEEVEDFNEELEETNEISNKTKSSLSTLFDNSIGKIKRFTYYLLGARSVFSLFMRYRSAYYQFNEEMQYQSELSQNAIALSLGPAFEFLGNVIAYASIGLAKFIELLTGVNVLSKVTTKGIKNYNKSLKETQTLVTGIDEITNLTNPQNLGLADQYKALDNFRDKIAEVEEFFSKNEWITHLANGLKKIWSFITEKILPIFGKFLDAIGGVEGALIMLGGFGVISAFSKLIGVAGKGLSAGTGLLGIAGLLTFIAGTWVINLVIKSSEDNDKLNNERQENAKNYQNIYKTDTKLLKDLVDKNKKLNKESKEYKNNISKINEGWNIVNRSIQSGDEDILNNLNDAEELAKTLDNMTNTNYYTKTFDISKAIGLDQASEMSKSLAQRVAGWLVGQDKIDQKRRQEYLNEYDNYTNMINNVDNGINSLQNKINKLVGKPYTLKISTEIISKIGEGATATANALSQAIVKSIRGYATGLDYVPYDNYPALLHKGEAVVPAKYNPTIHSQGNDYTNTLLETMIIKMDDLASRPNVFEIDGQQFANATYGLYDTQRKKQGYIEGVIR